MILSFFLDAFCVFVFTPNEFSVTLRLIYSLTTHVPTLVIEIISLLVKEMNSDTSGGNICDPKRHGRVKGELTLLSN